MSENKKTQKMQPEEQPKESIPTDERNGMRVFLQRAEVRLSTMHRVAGIFLNGAGLLILFPLLFKDVVRDIMIILATKTAFTWASLPYLLLVVPFAISLWLPVYSLYLLLKDLVEFYFAGNFPGYSLDCPTPRFVVPASVLPPDEAPLSKRKVLKVQYSDDDHGPGLRKFALPFDEDEEAGKYYDKVIKDSDAKIIPEIRTISSLKTEGIIPSNSESQREKEHFSTLFGLSGAYDRELVEEVAFTEVMLVRYASSLRRLVLRYAKALLVVIWTILMSFFIVALVHAVEQSVSWKDVVGPYITLAVAVLYMTWAWGTSYFVKSPLRWIIEMTHLTQLKTLKVNLSSATVRDAQLRKFEKKVELMCTIAFWLAFGFIPAFLVVHYILKFPFQP